MAHRAVQLIDLSSLGVGATLLLEPHHREDPRHLVCVDEQASGLGVEGRPTPFRPAVEARIDDRALRAWRDELAVRPDLPQPRQRGGVCRRRTIRQVVLGQTLLRKRRRRQGERLGGPRGFAFEIGWRHRPLLNREQRLTRFPIEEEHDAGFHGLRHGGDFLAVVLHVDEHRGGRKIAVPQVVMDHLEVPDPLARIGLQGKQAVGEEVGALSISAPEVEGGRAGRQKHEPALGVDADTAPGVGAADARVGVCRPRLVAEFTREWNRVERPSDLARADIVARGCGQGLTGRGLRSVECRR